MQTLLIASIIALVVASLIVIAVWTIVLIEYKKLRRQERINRLYERIRERTEDSGNESEGDTEELAALGEMGHLVPGDIHNL
uniref:Protein Vpu n=1 Tax=Human immunodeficiency virus type 1 TaxID=11676 RepID=C5HAX9_HV1|nr:vpu protein [Human immunodeficiency virus 1]